jgi:hypothetical protein
MIEPVSGEVIKAPPGKTARQTLPPPDEEDEQPEERPPPRKRTRPDEDAAEVRRRPRKKQKPRRGGIPPWVVVGGAVLLVAGVAVLLVVVSLRLLGRHSQDLLNPDLLVDVSGPWPEPMGMVPARANPASETAVTFHIVLTGASYQRTRATVWESEKAVHEKLKALVGPGVGSVSASDDAPSGTTRVMTVRVGPIQGGARALAQKIDFGTVVSVTDRVITLVIRSESLPPPAPTPDHGPAEPGPSSGTPPSGAGS